ncbi:hypothetical protein [Streptomyces flavofungini]|uniref:hypothetical protein n=1 Tax=Streptomyces flavofungini TaxID=68200 RepID=UPI0034DE0C50
MDVEIDLYSGRRNPSFGLAPETGRELMSRIAALPPASAGAAPPQGLGYRGLRITGGPSDGFAETVEIVVSGGVVVVRDSDGAERVLQDAGRALEHSLADLAATRLAPADMAVLRQALSGYE